MKEVQISPVRENSYFMKEALRTFRTNLRFCGDDVRVILFTSCLPDEGKSTVVFNLANAIRESGKKVLILDADIRKSVMIKELNAHTEEVEELYGLSHLLSRQMTMNDVVYKTNYPGLYILFAGPAVPNPTELLEKDYFTDMMNELREHFDYILVDTAPVGAVIDAAVIAKSCDGAVLVVQENGAGGRLINSVKKQMEASGIRILGAVLNKANIKQGKYYSRYYGKYYGKYYGEYYQKDEVKGDKKTKQGKK